MFGASTMLMLGELSSRTANDSFRNSVWLNKHIYLGNFFYLDTWLDFPFRLCVMIFTFSEVLL